MPVGEQRSLLNISGSNATINVIIALFFPLPSPDRKVSPKCQAELFDVRQQLMEDYSINPVIVAKCEVELEKHCKVGNDGGGQTIDCLMDLAEEHEGNDDTISEGCFKAVSTYQLCERNYPLFYKMKGFVNMRWCIADQK